MRKLQKLIIILMACSLVLSCGEKEPQPENPPQQENPGQNPDDDQTPGDPNVKTITVSFPSLSMTKVGWDILPDGLSAVWRSDDFLTIVSGDVEERYNIVSISEDGKVATLKGSPVNGDSFDVVLSRFEEDYENRTYEGQKQVADASAEHLLTFDVVLKGVDTYEEVTLNKSWAEQHGGTYAQSGALKLLVSVPQEVQTSEVADKIALTAASELFRTANVTDVKKKSISLEMNFSAGSDRAAECYLLTPMQGYVIPAGTSLTVDFVIEKVHYQKTHTVGQDISVEPGKCASLVIDSDGWSPVVEWLNVADWSVPYLNTLATNYLKMTYLFDNDYTSVWHAPWKADNAWYDQWFEGWSVTEKTDANPNGTTNNVRLPMVCVIDLGRERCVSFVDVRRRAKDAEENKDLWLGANNSGRDHTKKIEIWGSTDTSNEAGITMLDISSMEDLQSITSQYSRMWANKSWTKIGDVIWADTDTGIYKRLRPNGVNVRYLKLVVPGPDPSEVKAPILSVADVSIKGY